MDQPINILIVDDEPKNLTVLESILDDPSYRLVRAESADQALLALVVEEFALLILDIRMPGMTGFELAQMIKERRKTARVPIIFLTAYYNEDQHVLEGYESGAVDYLHKPVNAAILRSKVAVFAELHRTQRECGLANRTLLAEMTERRRAEEKLRVLNETLEQRVVERTEALRESEERLCRIFKQSPAGIVQTDAHGNMVLVNDRWCEMLGFSRAELLGRSVAEVTDASSLEVTLENVRRLAEGGPDFEIETNYRRKDGTILQVQSNVAGLRDAASRYQGLLAVVLDLTERHRAEAARHENERNYRALAVASSEITYRMSADWSTMLPLDGRQFFASSDQPLTDWAWLDQHLPRDEQPRVRQAISEAIARKTLFELEHRVRRPDGSIGWTFSRAVPILDANEEVIAWFGAASDITERKHAEAALRESAERLGLALSGGKMGMWEWDMRSGQSVWNAMEYELLGLSEGDVSPSAELFFRHVHPEDLAPMRRSLDEVRPERPDWKYECRIFRADGALRWLAAVGKTQYDADGRPERMVGVNFDITEHKESEATLAEANEQLGSRAKQLESLVEQRTAKLTETIGELEGFAYSITHDLRAPLRAVNSFSHMLAEDYAEKLDDDGKRLIDRISQSVTRMDNLILDVLQYSRVLRLDLKLEPLNADRLVRGILDSYPDFQEPHATIVIEGELHQVLANEAALTQCFSNLVNNAVKFVPAGTKPRVTIRAEAVDSTVRFWIKDNGIGIEPKYLETIFGLFHRLSNDYEGTGVGLSIVRKAVERMGGKAGAESEPGLGSRFWFQLQRVDHESKSA